MIQTKLKGMGVALITPFKEDESVDYDALMRMVDYLLQNNADFLCVLGTTAETPTLTEEEKKLERDELEPAFPAPEKEDPEEIPENNYSLDQDETFFLLALIKKENWQDYLKEHHLMASILADSINEKLFDEIGDSVIEFNEQDQPEIVEDYQEDLDEIFLKKDR